MSEPETRVVQTADLHDMSAAATEIASILSLATNRIEGNNEESSAASGAERLVRCLGDQLANLATYGIREGRQ